MAVFARLSNYLKGRTSVNGLRSMVRQINSSILLPKTQTLIPAWQWSTFTTKSTFSTAQSPSSAHPSRVQKWKRLTSRSPPRLLQVSDGFFLNLRRFEYLWQDSENFKRPTKMPAPEYIEHLMAWVQGNIDNEAMFPSRIGKGFHNHCGFCSAHRISGVAFPKTFPMLIRQIFKRLYRVYAHIYCHHYPVIIQLGLEPHLNTSFKHYVLFIDEHGLASGKDFWGPLGDLVESMLRSDWYFRSLMGVLSYDAGPPGSL